MLSLKNLLTKTGLCNKSKINLYSKYQLVCIITWEGVNSAIMFDLDGQVPLLPSQIIEYLDFADKLVSETILGVKYNYAFFQCCTSEVTTIGTTGLHIPVIHRFYKTYDGSRGSPWTYDSGIQTSFSTIASRILQIRIRKGQSRTRTL